MTAAPDLRAELAPIDTRIRALRRALSHDHRDEPFWLAFGLPAPKAQSEREHLRSVANRIHVRRAMLRGRIHGTRFATLDEQRAWLEGR